MSIERPRRRPQWERLREGMDTLVQSFGPEHLSPDPLEIVRRFPDPRDGEIAGFLCAALAFGSARGAVRSGQLLLQAITGDCNAGTDASSLAPGELREAVLGWDARTGRTRLRAWRHRWLGPSDASAAVCVLAEMIRRSGSIERFFAEGDPAAALAADEPAHDRTPDPTVTDLRPALTSFCERALALAPPRSSRWLRYWFAGPATGGASKRLCLWLRWMCRRDQLDPGCWTGATAVTPARLVIPLDVHVARISRYVGLLSRTTPDWRAAVEITARLRQFAPTDPVRYDYALCRLGILKVCPKRREVRKCHACPLFDVCLL